MPLFRLSCTGFARKRVAILECFRSDCLRALDRTLLHQSQPESSFACHATAAERRFRRFCAPLGTCRHAVLRRRRLHTRPSQRQGSGNDRLPGRRHPAREPRRNKEDQGLGRVRTDGGPLDEGSGATVRPPSRRHRQASQRHRLPDYGAGRSEDLVAGCLFEGDLRGPYRVPPRGHRQQGCAESYLAGELHS